MAETPAQIFCPPLGRQEPIEGGWLWRAPAKINLTLHVGVLRPDGFHGLDSLVAKISLYDVLEFRPRSDGQITLRCEGFDCGRIEDNLVYRAARTMQERVPHLRRLQVCEVTGAHSAAVAPGVDIRLVKNIPPGSGLGGGSSDAATTLMALNGIWAPGVATPISPAKPAADNATAPAAPTLLPPDELAALAATLGSDVPLFLDGPAMRMRGRGEIIEPTSLPPFWAVLYLSGLHCATSKVYRAFDEQTAKSRRPIESLPTPADALKGKPTSWVNACVNDLQVPALEVCPELAEVMRDLSRRMGQKVLMTGSGSGLFVLADDEESAMAMVQQLPADTRRRSRVVRVNPW